MRAESAVTGRLRRAAWVAAAAVLAIGVALWLLGFRIYVAEVLFRMLALPLAALAAAALAAMWLERRSGVPGSQRRAALSLVVLALTSITLGRALAFARPHGRSEAGKRRTVALVTYNVLFRGGDPDASIRMLARHEADVFAFQEVTPAWLERLTVALGATHPHRVSRAVAGTHGLALFSRFALGEPTYLNNSAGRAIAQCVPVLRPASPFLLCNVHLASPAAVFHEPAAFARGFRSNADMRVGQWRDLRDLIGRRFAGMRDRVVVAGDLNTLESEPLYDEIRRDLVDAFRERRWTFGATFPNRVRLPPWPVARIDYVLVTPTIAPEQTEVLPPSGSDHLGVRAVLRVPPSEGPTPQ